VLRKEILISGFGGQGVVRAGQILGYSSILAGLRASMLVSHGTETRGGYVRSQVILADEPVDNPAVERADIFCALSQAAYDRFLPLAAWGLTLYDPYFVAPAAPLPSAHLALAARGLALEKSGRELAANMIFLGAALRGLALIPLSCALQAAREIMPRHAESNTLALEAGYRHCTGEEAGPLGGNGVFLQPNPKKG
jgi:2-oxoglutarate ferredoxin oxidoreductase subunit gamma